MRFLHDPSNYDLTYSDVFFVPNYSDVSSRFDVDLTTTDGLGTSIPLIVSNMNAVAGSRMSETVARRGGLTVLPQDIPHDILGKMITYIKSRHTVYETPLTMTSTNTINEALGIIHKRAHQAVIIVNQKNEPIGIFTQDDAAGHDLFTQLGRVMRTELITVTAGQSPKRLFEKLHKERVQVAPVIENKKMIGVISQKGALRTSVYSPAVDKKGRLLVAVAIGISGDVKSKTESAIRAGADILVLDTAHGHQKKMIEAIKKARKVAGGRPIVAGNVVTAEATKDLLKAGADIIKVGVGPGAMCTTRMMTGVGRPQFSAILECAPIAKAQGKHIWADGGIRYPRDVALALAGGASSVMFGSWWAGTYESAGDVLRDHDGRLYKEHYGMASRRAVRNRTSSGEVFEQARRELFEEGISNGRLYLNSERPSAEDIIDYIVAGVRSSMTYAGARNISEFQEKAIVGIQSSAGYQEGQAVETNWDSSS
ncbi:MAG TPA: GuaB1 family IMP dehydrogenase-related protein [Candidatus Babeliales bacterium]|nr:GuaB1 family IMP dehydrogenase-related protein [Candidatus Babeliales bacterium]